jgi:hypothetical protein
MRSSGNERSERAKIDGWTEKAREIRGKRPQGGPGAADEGEAGQAAHTEGPAQVFRLPRPHSQSLPQAGRIRGTATAAAAAAAASSAAAANIVLK